MEIAPALGVSQGTTSKELQRNTGMKGYREKQSERLARDRQNQKLARVYVILDELKEEDIRRLRLKHSPEQISIRLKGLGQNVSHETIYRFISIDPKAGASLYRELRINGKRRYPRRAGNSRSKIPNRQGLECRPNIVDERLRF